MVHRARRPGNPRIAGDGRGARRSGDRHPGLEREQQPLLIARTDAAPPAPGAKGHASHETVSAILRRLAGTGEGHRISLGQIMDALGDRGYGLLIFVLAAPNAIPGPAVPFLSLIFAVPMALIAAQLALGREEPRLPG